MKFTQKNLTKSKRKSFIIISFRGGFKMGIFKKLSVVFLVIGAIVTAIVLSSCTINVVPPQPNPPYQPTAHWLFSDVYTNSLNCAGVFEDGDYSWEPFQLTVPATVEVTVWSNNLPPSNFDIYIMTDSQYNMYYQIWNSNDNIDNAAYLFEWDLTQFYNGSQYYLDSYTNFLPAGNYYLVIANNYYQFGRGAYGSAYFNLISYY
jgi:hypothetical protein